MSAAHPPDTTVIVATHNRPDTLRQALRSVAMQRHAAWAALVVGDACDDRTQAVMAEFAHDRRFLYVNLQQRCGEQAIPNSAAMQVAGTEFVALLNHDDLWLPDHLTIALERLADGRADFFIGRAAGCRDGRLGPNGEWVADFDRASPPDRTGQEAFGHSYEYVEPASSWVFRRDLAANIGPWRPAASLYRAPIQDWFLRAWRSGARMRSDERITCVKVGAVGAHHPTRLGKPWYSSHAHVHESILQRVQSALPTSGGLVRDARGDLPGLALAQPCRKLRRALPGPRWLASGLGRVLRWPWTGELYRRRGWDAVTLFSRCVGAPRGHLLRHALASRTGEALPPPPPLQAAVDEILAARQRAPWWPGWVDA